MEEHCINKFSVWKRNGKILILSPSPLDWILTNKEGFEIFTDMIDHLEEYKKILSHLPNSVHNLYNFLQKNLVSEDDTYSESCHLFSSPQTVYIHLTNKCNLKCKYCYATKYKNSLPEMTLGEGRKILDQCKEQLQSPYIVFTGGEPLLNQHFIELATYSLSLGFRVGLLTNGTMIEHLPLHLLKKIDFQISLDGINGEINSLTRGKYRETMTGVERLLQHGVKPEIRATLTKYSKNYAMDFYKYWIEKGVGVRFFVIRQFGINDEFSNLGLSNNELSKLFDLFAKELGSFAKAMQIILIADHLSFFKPINSCGVANSNIAIDGQGNIYPCIHLCVPELKIGNILNEDIVEILKSSQVGTVRCKVKDIKICAECSLRYICGGGCKAEVYFENKRFADKNPNCDFLKELMLKRMFEEDLVK